MCQERVGANLMFALELFSFAAIVRGRTQGSPLYRAGLVEQGTACPKIITSRQKQYLKFQLLQDLHG